MSGEGVVHIVDDDDAVRDSLALLLRAHGMAVRSYGSGAALLEALPLAQGCLILDLKMPDIDGLDLLAQLRARACHLPALVVSAHADVRVAVRAMKAGAVNVIEKPCAETAIVQAAREALALAPAETAPPDAASRLAGLTPREMDVLRGMVQGLPNKAMGLRLGISPRTVEIHRAKLMEKLGCRSLAEVVRLALEAGRLGGLD
jgi:two-component system response regulator FixJ